MAAHDTHAVIIAQVRPAVIPILGHLMGQKFITWFERLLGPKTTGPVEKLLRRKDHVVLSPRVVEVHRVVFFLSVVVPEGFRLFLADLIYIIFFAR